MNAWERRFLELEISMNSFRESNTERFKTYWTRMERLEAFSRENRTEINELKSKINPVSESIHSENQQVNLKFLNYP